MILIVPHSVNDSLNKHAKLAGTIQWPGINYSHIDPEGLLSIRCLLMGKYCSESANGILNGSFCFIIIVRNITPEQDLDHIS